jgi:hypothetical protein
VVKNLLNNIHPYELISKRLKNGKSQRKQVKIEEKDNF